MGHALGLQHTFTSSVMSTEAAGRATSLYSPLAADDVAGISYLYPRGNLAQSSGSIAGRITSTGGQGIHMASVVAIFASSQKKPPWGYTMWTSFSAPETTSRSGVN